jgi:hypothetical protein
VRWEYRTDTVRVTHAPKRTSVAALIRAVEATGFGVAR